ncbi:MAG: hypothetical protein JO006_20985 [Paucibacter sp.]|nr:hypothetical protein [Roseateles sp.]
MVQLAAPLRSESTQYELSVDMPAPIRSSHEQRGFALGKDFAAHGVTPPVEHLSLRSPLLAGWQAGRAVFGQRKLKARAQTERWLALRLFAWARGRSFEDVQLTPLYLQQIAVTHCPITRELLGDATLSIDRVRDDAGYAAGNLAVMSQRANQAKGRLCMAQALERAEREQASEGLTPAQWRRVAILASFVTELPHEQASALPLAVLPPNRLRLFNPIQALQTLVTRQFMTAGWSQRLARLQALLPSAAQPDFNRFVLALAPRVLAVPKQADAIALRAALEDAWTLGLVQKRWTRFALQLDARMAEKLVQRAAQLQLAPMHVQQLEAATATEGWAVERGGYAGLAALH